MSIYAVKLSEWYPHRKNPEQNYYCQIVKDMCKLMSCHNCGQKYMRYKRVWGHHSLPWGYGDIWCSKRCLKQDKS